MNAEVERILQDRSNREFGWSYKLHQGQSDYGPLKYGLDVAIEENFIDEKRMAVRIPFADGNSRDGGGDVLECAGIDTSRHRSNPICLFNHAKEVVLPIGMAEDPETGEYTVAIDTTNRKASLLCFFYQGKGLKTGDKSREYEHAIFCEQLFDLVAQKMVRSGSIGYQVIEARPIQPDYRRGTPQGLHLLRVLMLEGSLVVLPMNQDTVRKVLSMDQVCGKSLSPILVKSLEPYAGEKTVMVQKDTELEKPSEQVEENNGDKSMSDKKDKAIPSTEAKKKNMDDPVEPVVDPVVEPVPDDLPMNEILDEPMGAKVLRRMYGDAKALHQEWSETLPVLADNPNISKMIQQKMKELQREMKTCTKCWKREKAYKELEPLDMDGDGDPDAIVETPEEEMPVENPEEEMAEYTDEDIPEGMQGEDVEPTPEEVVEGMDKFPDDDDDYEDDVQKSYKRLKSKKIKALLQRGKKSKALAAAQKMLGKKNLDTDTDDNDESENVENLKGKRLHKKDRVAGYDADTRNEEEAMFAAMRERGDIKRVKDGMAFLKALSEDDSELDDEGRMKAYHYAKSFEDVRGPDREDDTDEKGMKCDDDVEQIAPFKSLLGAIKFLHRLSRSKDFGDRHRAEAKYWHRQLEDESGEDEEEIVGSMDQKSFALDLSEQTKQLEELQALLAQV